MQYIVKKKIGAETHTWMVDGKNIFECQMEAQKFSFPDIETCGCCGSKNIHLYSKLAQSKFKYLEVRCYDCKGSLTFGQKQDDPNVFYLRRDKDTGKFDWQSYSPEEKTN